MNAIQIIKNGIVKENPTFVLMLGMCPNFCHEWHVDGLGHDGCAHLHQLRDFLSEIDHP